MKKEIIYTPKAAKSKSPISQATRFGNLVFAAGQGPIDPVKRELIQGDMHAMVRRTLDNIKAVLEEAGTSMENVLKVTCYLADLKAFPVWNEVYLEYFKEETAPARVTVQVILGNGLPLEVDAIACIPD